MNKLSWFTRSVGASLLLLMAASSAATAEECTATSDGYPTAVIADYVLGCMAANGNSFESLHQCSCSIDYISERMSLEDYEMIETVMQVQQDRGQRGTFYRDSTWAKERVDALLKDTVAIYLALFLNDYERLLSRAACQ